MKKAKFITNPNYKTMEAEHPWHKKERVYNSRSLDLEPSCGLCTFMKKFDISSTVRSATLRITALGVFEALVNGKRIGADGTYDELMPLWTDYRCRVFECEYDILPYIKKKGENFISARVSGGWWAGRISFGFYGFKSPALSTEIELTYKDGSTEIIATDESWQTTVAGPVMTADIWDGEYFDARVPDPCVYPDTAVCLYKPANSTPSYPISFTFLSVAYKFSDASLRREYICNATGNAIFESPLIFLSVLNSCAMVGFSEWLRVALQYYPQDCRPCGKRCLCLQQRCRLPRRKAFCPPQS